MTRRAGNTNVAIAVAASMLAELTGRVAIVVDTLALNTRVRTDWRWPSGNTKNGGRRAGCEARRCVAS